MSATMNTLAAPIHRLNRDLLWNILTINSNMFSSNKALETTCATSQVCQDWRNFMLETPSLWGKLIDLDHLNGENDAWRNELLRRSGTSMLWIKGQMYTIKNHPQSRVKFFFNILHENWQRIEKLMVGIDVGDLTRWAPLTLPAPHLQTFYLTFWKTIYDNGLKEPPFGPLFANQAPMLREFGSKAYPFDLQAPWLHRLRSLEINASLNIREILTALQSAPNLERLRVEDATVGDLSTPLPCVNLNQLDILVLFVDLKPGATLIDHLDLPPGCSLEFFPHSIWDVGNIQEDVFRPIVQTISKFARRYFQFHIPRKILLEYSPTIIKYEDMTNPDEWKFDYWIRLGSRLGREFLPYMTTTLFNELALPEFAPVTEFKVNIRGDLPTSLFISFLAHLPSVEVLDVDEWTIDYLLEVRDDLNRTPNGSQVLFPHVKSVKLSWLTTSYPRGGKRPMFEFILSRIDDGCPIEVLELTKLSDSDRWPDLDFLEEVQGLKVLWTRRAVEGVSEYICGTGNPERLRLR